MPPSANNQDESTVKRHKSVAHDLTCPITLELPFDPVTAEDGRVYERSAIEEHFKGKTVAQLKSPMTNERMGKRLFPAVQIKNMIETLIETSVITGDLAANWKKKEKQKKHMEDLLKMAESGNGDDMYRVGVYYERGTMGFQKDLKLAYSWYKRTHAAGNVKGTANLGKCYLLGSGVAKCHAKGIMFLGIAAAEGSNLAACFLGLALSQGKWGFPVDHKEAIHWLQKALDQDRHWSHLNDDGKDQASQEIQRLTNQSV